MAELVWRGKASHRRRAGARAARAEPRDDELFGDSPDGGWRNRLIHGDTADVLPSLLPALAGRVALVYIDPPFDTGSDFAFRVAIPGATNGAARLSVPAYEDSSGLDAWLSSFHDTARCLHELLVEGGSLYVHLDTHVVHYAKVLLDEVFGPGAFQREIVWRIGWVSGFKSRANNWIRNHDAILFYAKKGASPVFHKQYLPYPPGYVRRGGARPRGPGYPIDDVWNGSAIDRLDSIQIKSFSREKVGFPTQKNESLVARIVRASSSPGDLVLDCFAGSGTTAIVAERLDRRWIACDASPVAIHATRKRLLALGAARPFVVQSAALAQSAAEDAAAGAARAGARRLSARASVDGPVARVVLDSFTMPPEVAPPSARAHVREWSQWIDGWCVDWDHRGGPLRAAFVARRRDGAPLELEAVHRYELPGRYVVLVRAYDVLGGVTAERLRVVVSREPAVGRSAQTSARRS